MFVLDIFALLHTTFFPDKFQWLKFALHHKRLLNYGTRVVIKILEQCHSSLVITALYLSNAPKHFKINNINMALTNRINATFQTSECLPMPIINLCGKITAFDNICELKKCDESACEVGLVGVCNCEWVCARASGCVQVRVGVCVCEQEKDTSRKRYTRFISLSLPPNSIS